MKLYNITIIFLLSIAIGNAYANFTPEIDLFVWHASQEPTSTWASIVTASGDHTTKFQAANVDFNWDMGVKVGTRYAEQSNAWDSGVYWTYFKADTNSSVTNAAQLVFPEFFSGFISGNFFFGGNLNWRLIVNMLDLEIGKQLHIGENFAFRPTIGIKGGTINQAINCNWNALVYTATEKVTNNFFGLGPSFGINTQWRIYKNINLLADFSTALLWGNWQVTDQYIRPNVPGVVTATTITTNMHSAQLGTLMFDYFLGLTWQSKNKPNISLQIGYEMQWWANQARIVTFQQLPVHGDLTLQGGTCRIILSL